MRRSTYKLLPRGQHRRIHRRGGLRFRLLTMLLLVTGCCVLLAWWTRPQRYVTEALFRISAQETQLVDEGRTNYDAREFDDLRNTHATLATSDFVLAAAARDPAVAGLPVLASQVRPVDWLVQMIDVDFPGNGEIMSIQLKGNKNTLADDALIVDAVAQAYQQEVVFGDRKRKLMTRDVKATSLSKRNLELRKKMIELFEVRQAAQDNPGDAECAVDAELLQEEVDSLMDARRQLLRQLEIADINMNAPHRIEWVQRATARAK